MSFISYTTCFQELVSRNSMSHDNNYLGLISDNYLIIMHGVTPEIVKSTKLHVQNVWNTSAVGRFISETLCLPAEALKRKLNQHNEKSSNKTMLNYNSLSHCQKDQKCTVLYTAFPVPVTFVAV